MSRNLIISVLKILAAEPGISELKRIAQEIIDKFFPDVELPEFKIVNSTVINWLGRCSVKYSYIDGKNITVIELQKSILGDEKTVHRTLAHELIHAWQFSPSEGKRFWRLNTEKRPKEHDEDFYHMADKMNAVYGKNYITDKSDASDVINVTNEYFIIIQPFKDKYGATKAIRPSREQKQEIARRIIEEKAHVLKIKDSIFHKTINIKKNGGFNIYKNEDIQTKLAELYASKNVDDLFKRVN